MTVSTLGRRALAAWAALTIALGISGPAQALNPDIRLNDYNHAAWATRDGAPGEITSMAQTPDGWLWLGTTTGLYRFDGVRFDRYEPPNKGEVAKRRIGELRASAAGDLWISYSVGGLSVLHKNGQIDDIEPLDGRVGNVLTLAIEDDGSAWIAGGRGFFRYAHGQMQKLTPEQGLPQLDVYSVLMDQYQQVWALYADGVYRLNRSSGKFALVYATPNRDVSALVQSPDGRLWISSARQMLALPQEKTLPSGQPRILPRPALFNSLESRVGAQFDRDGNLWSRNCPETLCVVARADQHNGPLIVSSAATDKLAAPLRLTSPTTHGILEDMEGNIWVATQTGLDRFRENSLIPVRLPVSSGAFSMASDTEGVVWLSDVYTKITWRLTANQPPQRSPEFYRMVAQDRQGGLLLAKRDRIERRYRGQTTIIPLPPGRDGKVDHDVMGLVDDGKVLWLASPQIGLNGLLDDQWRSRSAFSLPDRIFLGVAGRKPGERWQATGDGTIVFNDNGKLTTYDAHQIGLATMISVNDDVVAGGDKGLAIFTGEGFRKLKAARPEALTNISGMAVSADGDRWFNGSQGVIHVRRADWQTAMTQAGALLKYELLGALEGYSGQAMLDTRLPSVHADKAGNLWFMTSAGVLRLSLSELRHNRIAPLPTVQSVDAGDTSYPAAEGLRLPPGAQNFSIQFTAPGLGKPEAMRFQYQLSGVNDDWQEAGNRRIAYYTNVAPGSYSFRVRAFNDDGLVNAEDARFDFEIEPKFVQTIWFKALCVLAVAGALYLLYLYRLRIATQRVAARMSVRMAERERIARTLHDTFLQSVQALILRLDVVSHGLPEDARDKLAPILDQANDTIEEGRDQVHELRTGRVDDVESAAEEAGRQLHAEHPATTFGIAVVGPRRKLQDTVAEEACEIAREALRNAFHHAHAKHVEARIIYERERFLLQISDDGIGLAADAAPKARHYGLTGMQERATRAGGKLEITSTPHGGGVRITFKVAERAAYAGARRWWRRRKM
jgi:signal transduction histidine kinase/ligand-binding sensor domain-containing protein